jgi:hypothetical protein
MKIRAGDRFISSWNSTITVLRVEGDYCWTRYERIRFELGKVYHRKRRVRSLKDQLIAFWEPDEATQVRNLLEDYE